MNWRIYYSDGLTFDSTQGEPEAALGMGVVCIVQADRTVGRSMLTGWDFYYYHTDGRWWGCDQWGLMDRLVNRLPVRAVSLGRTVPEPEYADVIERASTDADFPRRCSEKPRAYERPSGTNK